MSKNSLHAHIELGKVWIEQLKADEKRLGRGNYQSSNKEIQHNTIKNRKKY